MSRSGTVIIYNGIRIDNVHTDSIEQSAYMDQTNADYVAIEVKIVATGILHRIGGADPSLDFSLGSYVGNPAGPDAGANLGFLRDTLQRLNAAKKRFRYYIGDLLVWDIAPATSAEDKDRYGSHPAEVSSSYFPGIENTPDVRCNITRVISDHSCWVKLEIRFVYSPCYHSAYSIDTTTANAENVLSLRWWCADDIDTNDWLTRRTWNGVLQIKSRHISPHAYRYLTYPPLPRGWRRDRIRFTESKDSLSLTFDITDSEVIANPPYPASKWSGSVEINAAYGGIAQKEIRVAIELGAPKGVKKSQLAFLILRIMDTKVNWYSMVYMGTAFVKSLTIRESIAENVVSGELLMTVTKVSEPVVDWTKEPAGFPKFIADILDNDLGDKRFPNQNEDPARKFIYDYDPQRPAYWVPRPDTVASIVIPMIQSPCTPSLEFARGVPSVAFGGRTKNSDYWQQFEQEGNQQGDVGQGQGQDQTPITEEVDDVGVQFTPGAPYLMYKISSRYVTDKGISAFPVYGNTRTTSDYPDVVIARLRRPVTRREFRFEASRINKWPITPTDSSFYDEETAIAYICDRFELMTHGVEVSADGKKYRYYTSGSASYILNKTPKPGDKIFVGSPPHITGATGTEDESDVAYLENDRRDGGQFKPGGVEYQEPQAPTPPPAQDPPTSPTPGLPAP